jgi:succinate dehydrogenase / fumarate reductase iron-sulfur subunit
MPDVTFRIKRFDRQSGKPSAYQEFVLPVAGSLTVLEALFEIQEKVDGSIAFRYCCRSSICGSCAMYINGRYRLACQTNLRHLHGDVVTVEPLPHMPLVRDLVWDMDVFYEKYEAIKPWLIHNSHTPDAELLQSPKDRHYLSMPIDCILCAWRVPLPHHHQLHRGLPQGAQPHRGHPVAQEGGRAPQAVRPQQVRVRER